MAPPAARPSIQSPGAPSTQSDPIQIKQNAAANRSDDSVDTISSNASVSSQSSFDLVRCSRCQRSLSIDPSSPTAKGSAVKFATNSYYCQRCANRVGFLK